jgi:hypothetical protein
MYILAPFLSVILGYLVAFLLQETQKKNIKLVLAFSGSFLLALTVFHLLPELYHDIHHHEEHTHSTIGIGVFIMIGIFIQIVLEFFSKGAEHGHVHGSIKQIPWMLFVSLCIHALLEGFPVHEHHNMAWGIAVHHLPIAIILTTFFMNAHMNRLLVFIFMIVFALMTPMGTLIAEYATFLAPYHTEITAVVVGILFHISSTIIYESNEGHKFNFYKLIVIVTAAVLAYYIQ